MDRKNLSLALRDVRTAYRLVHQYQRRILDLTTELASKIDAEALFRHWEPSNYWAPTKSGNNPAGHWAWDGLPFYDFCTFYVRTQFWKDEHDPGDWMLVLRVSADTGYPDSYDDSANNGREPGPSDFSQEEAQSAIRVYAYQYTESRTEAWIGGAYRNDDRPGDAGATAFGGHLRALGIMAPLVTLSSIEDVNAFGQSVKDSIEKWLVTPSNAADARSKAFTMQDA